LRGIGSLELLLVESDSKDRKIIDRVTLISASVSLVASLIQIILNLDDISIWISTHLVKSYSGRIIILAISFSILIMGLAFLTRMHKRLGIFRSEKEKRFKSDLKWKAKCVIFWFTFLVIGYSYYYWMTDLSFRWSRFEDDEVGILLANFREIPLDDYIPQGSYSNLLAEKLPQYKTFCTSSAKVNFKDSPVFITSNSEAISYGKKINAKFVLYGEIHRSASIIRIIPSLISAGIYEWGVGRQIELDAEIFAECAEDWRLDATPIHIDKIAHILDQVLVMPIYYEMKQKHSSAIEMRQYLECALSKFPHLPIEFRIAILYELGYRYSLDSAYARAIDYWHKGIDLMTGRDSLLFINPMHLRAIFLANLTKTYASLQIQDSVDFYFSEAFNTDYNVILNDSALFKSLINHPYVDSVLNFLMIQWRQEPNIIIGNYINRIYNGIGRNPDIIFTRKFDSLYGSHDRIK
jgi:hypothetical protein